MTNTEKLAKFKALVNVIEEEGSSLFLYDSGIITRHLWLLKWAAERLAVVTAEGDKP
jgi:hypothetical protein